ncbi:MAG: hypothetical protein HY906_21060 [Deltaproteobacteria bacterium]|nr:hypothetical protein [Deltaproteobacteria bacterium]
MLARLAALLSDPDQSRLRRTALIALLVLVATGGLWAISSARQKTPRVTQAAAPLLGDARGALTACVCPACGAVVAKQAGRECEELRCPRCRTDMKAGFLFSGAAPALTAPAAAAGAGVGGAMPAAPPPAAPEREGLRNPTAAPGGAWPAPGAGGFPATEGFAAPYAAAPPTFPPPIWTVNFVPQRPGAATVCVCPGCGTRVPNDGHLYCPGLRCPACGRTMMAGVRVGAAQPSTAAQAAAVAADPTARGELVATPGANAPCTRTYARPQTVAGPSVVAPTNAPTYSGSVAEIVSRNCLRCHGGALRNLSTYQNIRSYAQSGLLGMMIQPGGPMSHFLAPAEAPQLLDWVDAGEPR